MPEFGSVAWLVSQAFAAVGYPIRFWAHWQRSRIGTLAGSATGAAFQTIGLCLLGMWGVAAAGLISVIRNLVHLGSDRTTRATQITLGLVFAALADLIYVALTGAPDSIAWWFPVLSITVTAIGQSFPSRIAVKASAVFGTAMWAATYFAAGAWVAFAGDMFGTALAVIALVRILSHPDERTDEAADMAARAKKKAAQKLAARTR